MGQQFVEAIAELVRGGDVPGHQQHQAVGHQLLGRHRALLLGMDHPAEHVIARTLTALLEDCAHVGIEREHCVIGLTGQQRHVHAHRGTGEAGGGR